MKLRILSLLITALAIGQACLGQTANVITCENYPTDEFKGTTFGLSDYREINSGSKIVVTYEGDCPAELQGAFEYAAKLWEEVLPLTLPIKIVVKVEPIRGSQSPLSKVTFDTYDFEGSQVNMFASPLSMIKSVLLQESHHSKQYRFHDEIFDTSLLNETDMTITYNRNKLNEFSYSLDGNPNLSKYDFVTVAMRDIAIGLGFTTTLRADTANKKIFFTQNRPIPFEHLVINAIGSTDPNIAFQNATKGTITIPLRNMYGSQFSSLTVYAPSSWDNNTSLRFLVPNDDNPLSNLLTWDFGKGYIMRDLSGVNWNNIFCGALDWRRDETTGAISGSFSQKGTAQDILPFNGNITLSFDNEQPTQSNQSNPTTEYADIISNRDIRHNSTEPSYDNTLSHCKRYNLYSPDGPPSTRGISLSVLKKDGSWDCIEKVYHISQLRDINIENLKLNYEESEYARGTTGGLRYRLTECIEGYDNLYKRTYHTYRVKYFTRDFTPQRANISYTPDNISSSYASRQETTLNDDYFVDVPIGISNIEGTTKVIVEQLDEGETLPFSYEVEDFRSGYFIANLDRELSTKITVVSYNSNGFRRSNTITISPIGYPTNMITFNTDNETISINGMSHKLIESGKITYRVQNILNPNINIGGAFTSQPNIDIQRIPSGVYVLTLFHNGEKISNYKFIK